MNYTVNDAIRDLRDADEFIQNGEFKKARSTIAYVVFNLEKAAQPNVQQIEDTCWCGALVRSDNTCMNGHRQ